MTRFDPNLRVNRMRISAAGKIAYDEEFHAGLNIVSGQNSSGKSTIMDFIYYGLGGDLTAGQWREVAANCDSVMLEVSINGNTVTLWRDVEIEAQRPMRLFYGTLIEASVHAVDGWEIYPFKRGAKDSFSQVLFRFLGLPEVEYGETNTRLTINQVLRLLYADQMSPVEKIFRPTRFDLAITRQAVGDMLLGVYNDRYYKALIRKRDAMEDFSSISSQILSLIRVNRREGAELTVEWLSAHEANLNAELSAINERIAVLEATIFDTEFTDRLTLNDKYSARDRVIELQVLLGTIEDQLRSERLSSEDTSQYIVSLNAKLEELRQSSVVADEIGSLTFNFCPSCFAAVSGDEVVGGCSLCKSSFNEDDAKKRVLKLTNEYARQRDRAERVNADRQETIAALNTRRTETKELWDQAARHYTVSLRNPTSELRAELRDLNRKAGYAYRSLEDLARDKAIISELSDLVTQRDSLQAELDSLNSTIAEGKRLQAARTSVARKAIEIHALDFLKNDLARQSTFEDAASVTFEFDSDRLAVNSESYFSASSMVYLRNSFFASFLFAACNDRQFLHPRFLMMDTVEDKGMEPDRSKNFQRLLFKKSREATSDHQIIIATSMIAEELDVPAITVGDYYTHDRRTLRIGAS